MGKKKKILVDMDGVLADVYKPLAEQESKISGKIIVEKELWGIPELEAFPNLFKIVNTKGFFRDAPLIEDSVEGLRYLNSKYDVLVVSSATEFPNSLGDKQAWLNEHFPFISWRQMIFCGQKDSIMGDVMIDDHPKNLSFFKGDKIIFEQPHNSNIEDSSFRRVSGWADIMEIL
jgi:Uncharacterized protein conserved in bacteria